MIVITKNRDGKKIKVDVSQRGCAGFQCFSPHKYQHRSYNGTEGSMTRSDKDYSCSHRNYHGCPEEPKKNQRRTKEEGLKQRRLQADNRCFCVALIQNARRSEFQSHGKRITTRTVPAGSTGNICTTGKHLPLKYRNFISSRVNKAIKIK